MLRLPVHVARAVAIAALAVSVQAADARDLYVNNLTGSDEFAARSAEPGARDGPAATINRALRLACPSDRIVIANTGEPYREQLAIAGPRLHGEEGEPLVISAGGAVLDGSVDTTEAATWRHVEGDVFGFRPAKLTYQQLFRAGAPLPRVERATYETAAEELEPLQWALASGYLLLRVEQGRLPQSYDLRHAGLQTGVTLYNTHDVVIEDLVVQGFQLDGINAHELAKRCVLRRVECRANGRSGLSVGGVSRVRAERCNFYDNGRVQARTEGVSRLELEQCDVAQADGATPYAVDGGALTVDGTAVEGGG